MSGIKKQRLDDLLIAKGYFANRDEVLRSVIAREVRVGDEYATSPSLSVRSDAAITVKDKKDYVSRGGYKLKGALDAFHQSVKGLRCLDIGSSTGGFTDCLLQAGAKEVTCVDVNYGQLAWSIRTNERVRVFERTNIRVVQPSQIGAPFDLIVCDVSFIGMAQLASVFADLATNATVFIGLIKPQFESRRGETNRGIVEDPLVWKRVISEVEQALTEVGFVVEGVVDSAIMGKAGNREFLIRAVFTREGQGNDEKVPT